MELGGKSANIVFADANLDNSVKGVVSGIFAATGQTCVAGSRALIHRSIHDEFVDRFLKLARTARMGNPLEETTQVGPITTKPQYEKVLGLIEVAKKQGATCVLGGGAAKRQELGLGWFVEPTVFTHVTPEMRIAQEEVFGPVLSIMPFDSDEEALAIANGSIYGLAAGVWTSNIGRALKMAHELEAGTVWTNTYRVSSPLSPFGGYKRSGFGRESGLLAIREFVQEKSVWIETTGADTPNPFVIR
jgi:aldehyde dehydrogenase (NAD+)